MRLGKSIVAAAGLLGGLAPGPAHSGPFADELGRCLVTSSTESERGALLRWVFVAFAAHPQVQDLVAVTEERRQQATRSAATIFNRLMLRACRQQMLQALRVEGGAAVQTAFRVLGQAASADLMNSPAGAGVIEDLRDYFDRPGLEALMREAGLPVAPER